ncbi:hypothetical protein JCM10207_008469 [Rhodosporidiobolus poonsookiae]
MDSTDTKPSSSRLETLPNEVLRDIFEMAYSRDDLNMNLTSTARPLSKRLWPFQRDELFKDVRLTCYAELASFARAVVGTSELGALVKRLWLDIEPLEICGQGVKIEFPFPQARFPAKLLPTGLKALKHLGKLTLHDCSEVIREFFEAAATNVDFLPHLSDLDLDSTFSFTDDPFHSNHLHVLSTFTHLDALSMYVRETASCILPSEVSPMPPLPNITRLSVQAPVKRTPSFLCLLEQLVNLELLELGDFSEYHNLPTPPLLATVLSHLPNPANLFALKYKSRERTTASSVAFFVALARFTDLRHLSIDGAGPGGVVLTTEFWTALRTLPIEFLVLGECLRGLTDQGLNDFVSAPPPTLETVFLYQPAVQPNAPVWLDDLTPDGIVEAVEIADCEGIDLRGPAVDAALALVFEGDSEAEG